MSASGQQGGQQGKELLVGTVIIAAIIVAVVGTLWLQGVNWGRETTWIEVLSRDVGQLSEGNPVKFRGVRVGRVESVTVTSTGEAVRVGLALDGELAVAGDAVVIIAPESLFGDWQAEISTRSRFPQFEYFEVPAAELQRDTVVLGGYALPDISRLTAAADEISANLATLTDRFDRAFSEETAENLRATIDNIQQVSSEISSLINQQAKTFENVSGEVQRAASEIGEASAVARRTLERVDQTLASGDVDSILMNVRTATANIEEMTREVNSSTGALKSTLASADTAFGRIERITGDIEAGRGNLGLLLNDTTLMSRAENVLLQFELLLADVKANPRKYVRFSIF